MIVLGYPFLCAYLFSSGFLGIYRTKRICFSHPHTARYMIMGLHDPSSHRAVIALHDLGVGYLPFPRAPKLLNKRRSWVMDLNGSRSRTRRDSVVNWAFVDLGRGYLARYSHIFFLVPISFGQ
jgi:hypothetical protein